jgi:hypothetical protein
MFHVDKLRILFYIKSLVLLIGLIVCLFVFPKKCDNVF